MEKRGAGLGGTRVLVNMPALCVTGQSRKTELRQENLDSVDLSSNMTGPWKRTHQPSFICVGSLLMFSQRLLVNIPALCVAGQSRKPELRQENLDSFDLSSNMTGPWKRTH